MKSRAKAKHRTPHARRAAASTHRSHRPTKAHLSHEETFTPMETDVPDKGADI